MSKPPEAHRFRKGQSGNPFGRPKSSADTGQLLRKVLSAPVAVTEGGRSKKMTQEAALLRRLVSKAMAGDVAANKMVADLKLEGSHTAKLAAHRRDEHVALAREKIKRLFPAAVAASDWNKEPEEGSWLPPRKP